MTCREAIREIFTKNDEVLSGAEVRRRINSLHPGVWKDNTIMAHLTGFSVNAPASRWHPTLRKEAFLFSLGDGRYRLWNPETDGQWIVTETGVQLADADTSDPPDGTEGDRVVSVNATAEATITLERDMEASLVTALQQLESAWYCTPTKRSAANNSIPASSAV